MNIDCTSAIQSDTTAVAHIPHAISAIKVAEQALGLTHSENEATAVLHLSHKHQRLYEVGELKKRNPEIAGLVASKKLRVYGEGMTGPNSEGIERDLVKVRTRLTDNMFRLLR